MIAGVLFAKSLIHDLWNVQLSLVVYVVIGILTYGLIIKLMAPRLFQQINLLARSVIPTKINGIFGTIR